MQNQRYLQDDEIDLKELFKTLWKYKIFILVFTSIITFIALIYVLLKNPIPIYQGKMYLEIGQIQNKNFAPISIEKVTDLAFILNFEFKVDSNIPKNTSNLMEITFDNVDKNIINDTLIKVKNFVIEKHKKQTSFYESVIMTDQIGDIIISNEPINKPKKTLIVIVSFVTAFILSIFLVFFIEFIKSLKKEEIK
ncbi:Wzz/FepE/Etk N-terminal domain-containing protein [Aliarcobacter butzleri]|uniref:Wzz/FepE/Etk N-terminal domain-containing protein n=1 Tax=Aliarcobacter butzleri TaxID=28197 RepID=UPI00263ECDEA|nr:Wzz/FepE/Etk N-terminal domain-containing protein [Aliarcobacter butzleri]MDN5067863.1 Wzz/FepE/Etk N-terminal domain-containing protein [Aliarcobacter butzleri]MDN5072735.1 Wzz/FepE/Etk N-terminal domain-containing protein [Aliarcobacter butzleri]MDN5121713.1 Wzz/FepE/Etk N-terminal domain-containing protein [Aliarcobacter butzleri]